MRFLNPTPFLSIVLIMLAVMTGAHSQSQLTPSLSIQESFTTNQTATADESGRVTTISPNISYQAVGLKNSVSLNYALNAIYYNDLPEPDRTDHSLQLQSNFSHIPKRWNTTMTSSIKQANVSADGIQSLNPTFQSNNSQTLKTWGFGTNLQGNLTDKVNYQSGVNLDYADFESSASSHSTGVNLGLNSNTQDHLSWDTTFTSNRSRSAGDHSQIDNVTVNLNYRFNQHYSSFISADKSKTDNEFLNQVNTSTGLTWTPDRNTSFRLGIGKRGDNTTYTLDSSLKTKQITYQLGYNESITTSRALLIDDAADQQDLTEVNQPGLAAANQTLSIDAILVKKGTIGMTIKGKKSSLTVGYFQQTTTQNINNIGKEIREGLNINATRTLSDSSSAQISLARQETETTQRNTVDDVSLSYNRQFAKSINTSAVLRQTEQKSNAVANQYQQQVVSFNLNVTF